MTTSRSYGQNCSLARTMDLIGERWTVLIIRELARGPKRFGDLGDGLAGIGTTMLAARLKRLEAADVIVRAERGNGGYRLTIRGERLAHALGDLMLWGLELPDLYQPDDQSRAVWLAMNMQSALDRSGRPAPSGTYAFHVGDEHFWLHVNADRRSTLRDGTPPHHADASVTLSTAADFVALAKGASTENLDAVVEGDAERLGRLLETFRVDDTFESSADQTSVAPSDT